MDFVKRSPSCTHRKSATTKRALTTPSANLPKRDHTNGTSDCMTPARSGNRCWPTLRA